MIHLSHDAESILYGRKGRAGEFLLPPFPLVKREKDKAIGVVIAIPSSRGKSVPIVETRLMKQREQQMETIRIISISFPKVLKLPPNLQGQDQHLASTGLPSWKA